MAVASGAAKTLERAHLELGGKAPAVVFGDVDVPKTAAAIATGNHRVGETGSFFVPIVITHIRQSDAIAQEETFGPVITMQGFSTEDEAVTLASDVAHGLEDCTRSTRDELARQFPVTPVPTL